MPFGLGNFSSGVWQIFVARPWATQMGGRQQYPEIENIILSLTYESSLIRIYMNMMIKLLN